MAVSGHLVPDRQGDARLSSPVGGD
jgi:hypothetical protein